MEHHTAQVNAQADPSREPAPVRGHPSKSEGFADSLSIGLEAEREVAHDLFELGYWVSWPNPPTRALNSMEYEPGKPDLLVLAGQREIGLEIKSRGIDFSGPEDFPYDVAWVGEARKWQHRRDDPWAVVIVSRGPKAGRIVIPCQSRVRWVIARNDPLMLGATKADWKSWDWLVERLKHPTF